MQRCVWWIATLSTQILWAENMSTLPRCSFQAAANIMARAISECPNSGILWAEEILSVPRQQQKSRCVEALKRCDNDPHVMVAVAQLFERDRKYAKVSSCCSSFYYYYYFFVQDTL